MKHLLHYPLHQVEPYINWAYFFHAWRTTPEQSPELKGDAQRLLKEMEDKYQTHALVELFEANSDGEDIRISGKGEGASVKILPMLRQQHGKECLCWADFIRPIGTGQTDTIGVFATSVDEGMEQSYPTDEYRHLLCQTLADRLAEATAERMHEEVRRHIWGYAPDESLTPQEMFNEKYIGRRPSVGYPSLPDQSLNFIIDELTDMGSIGISLTESGAMRPHASTSGLLFAHPKARHFAIGKIGEDQLDDYARRRKLPVDTLRKFLAANLPVRIS